MSTQAPKSYRWLFWTLALVGFALDQGSKYAVFAWLYNDGKGDTYGLIPLDGRGGKGAFYLDAGFTSPPVRDSGEGLLGWLRTLGGDTMPMVNHGALWGMGRPQPGEEGTGMNTFFAAISLVAAVAIIWWSSRPAARGERWLTVSLGLILAGTLGNLYDRAVFSGVRDFLHWHYPKEPWADFPVFNFADCCLVCGAFLLLLQAFYSQPEAEDKPLAGQAAAPESSAVPAAPEQVAEVARVE
jgi:lipoprotein signal peptidase